MPLEWESLSDEELLRLRICDLGLQIPGTEVAARVEKLQASLDSRGLLVQPICYLGAEWQSPNGVPAICIPFYLANPRLRQLEMHQMLEIEGGTAEACDQLLFHECGHVVDHAYGLSGRKVWREVFGDNRIEYRHKMPAWRTICGSVSAMACRSDACSAARSGTMLARSL